MLNLKPDLLTRNAAELLAVDQVEFPPQTLLHDPLIRQITLAVHLLKNYSSHDHNSIRYLGGLSLTQLKPVIDYINDYLDQEATEENFE